MASTIPPFLTKTYDLVDDESTNGVVSWNQTGDAFIVWDSAKFSTDVLPNYFKHNNFSSFIRQLSAYSFHKLAQDRWEYSNENFKKGHKELLCEIHRRKIEKSPSNLTVDAGKSSSLVVGQTTVTNSGEDLVSGSTYTTSPSMTTMTTDLALFHKYMEISEEHEKLKKSYENVCSELVKSKRKCDELTDILIEQLRPKMKNQNCGSNDAIGIGDKGKSVYVSNDDDENDDENSNYVKLFRMMVKNKTKKRVGDEFFDSCDGGSGNKEGKWDELMKVGTS